MSYELCIRKLHENKLDCLNEINFCMNLFSRMQMNLNFVLNFSCDLKRLRSQRVILHHPAKCDGVGLKEEEILSLQYET